MSKDRTSGRSIESVTLDGRTYPVAPRRRGGCLVCGGRDVFGVIHKCIPPEPVQQICLDCRAVHPNSTPCTRRALVAHVVALKQSLSALQAELEKEKRSAGHAQTRHQDRVRELVSQVDSRDEQIKDLADEMREQGERDD